MGSGISCLCKITAYAIFVFITTSQNNLQDAQKSYQVS